MAIAVYVLCAATSMICAAMLARAYRRSAVRLLMWASLCFVGFALNNMLLFVDLVVVARPIVDLSIVRALTALASVSLLIYGLVWDAV